MLKVLIVDDEIKVCDLIYHLLDWDSMGLEVVGSRQDGLAAYEFIVEHKPDIVITDIRIPEYDGIELIRKTKEVCPDTYFIIISGYSHFEYAQEAIKCGVEDYILKPIKKKDLTETLQKLIEKQHDKARLKGEREHLQARIDVADEQIKRGFLDQLLAGVLSKENMDRAAVNEKYHCKFKNGVYQCVVIKPLIPFKKENRQPYYLLAQKTKDIVENSLKGACSELIAVLHQEGVICIVNGSAEELGETRRQLKKIKSAVTCMRDVFRDVSVTIGIGRAVTGLAELKESVRGARAAALERFTAAVGLGV
ncbi:MAG TPA: hypothetical protein DEB31_00720, partial [Clostridiales bacterium]|nr:hypothetical protein [Clostridiales bacterium]